MAGWDIVGLPCFESPFSSIVVLELHGSALKKATVSVEQDAGHPGNFGLIVLDQSEPSGKFIFMTFLPSSVMTVSMMAPSISNLVPIEKSITVMVAEYGLYSKTNCDA